LGIRGLIISYRLSGRNTKEAILGVKMSNNLTREDTENTAGDIYMDLVAIERYLWLFKKSLRTDLSEGHQKLYMENLENIQNSIEATIKKASRVYAFFNGDDPA
jgi:hypothetical protein